MKTLRKTVSVLLLFAFLVTIFSTIGLEFRPDKLDPSHASFVFLGVSIASLKYMHTVFGYGMLGLSLFHLVINFRSILNYIRKNKSSIVPSKTVVIATVFASFLLVLTIATSSYHDDYPAKIAAQNGITENIMTIR